MHHNFCKHIQQYTGAIIHPVYALHCVHLACTHTCALTHTQNSVRLSSSQACLLFVTLATLTVVPLLAAGVPLPHAPAVASCFFGVTHSHNMSWAHTRTRAISCDYKERSHTHMRMPSAGLRQQPAFKVTNIVGIIEIGGVCRPCRRGSPFHIVMRQCTRTCKTENVERRLVKEQRNCHAYTLTQAKRINAK